MGSLDPMRRQHSFENSKVRFHVQLSVIPVVGTIQNTASWESTAKSVDIVVDCSWDHQDHTTFEITSKVLIPLAKEKLIDVAKPDKFSGRDPTQWRRWVDSIHLHFHAKPLTYASPRARILFAVSYMTDLAREHWQNLVTFRPNNPALTDYQKFINEFA